VLQGARAALHPDRAQQAAASPVLPGQIYEGVPNRALVEHCLDQRGAWGVAGWPAEDVLQAIHHRMPPDRRSVNGLLAATDADASLEVLENLLAEEPVLAYRFLRFANSADFKLREGIDSARQGMMVLGLSRFRSWLVEQSAGATEDVNLLPVRRAMVVRARLMEHLLDAGDAERLRHEVVLCGLLSNIDMVVGEPMQEALQDLPLSERVLEALVSRSGPYAPYLELAAALEYPGMSAVPALCEAQELDIAVVNREVLRVLSQSQRYPARAR
jgi:c-di-GMP-related signal transduction protein